MLQIHSFTFNPFQENTYLIWDSNSKEAAIIDPGCYTTFEQEELTHFISRQNIKPTLLLNTHAHIDHVLGNAFVKYNYQIPFYMHAADLPVLHSLSDVARMYGVPATPSPQPDKLLSEGDIIKIGSSSFNILFVPGHSPGSIAFYNAEQAMLISGDVLFYESIGRTDLPGGDYYTLMHSIQTRLLTLPDNTKVYSGHGPATNIGHERRHNPFIIEYLSA
jgi:glyoxylase-like metal-dependent hydrolase (beta-lactamase superfamily II)